MDWLARSELIRTGLKAGWTLVDVRALDRLREAVAQGGSLDDVEDIISPPVTDVAWRVPQEVMLIDEETTKNLQREIERLVEQLRKEND